jgi:hypothetical protein
MVEETVWVEKGYVRSRLSSDELWLMYRLVNDQPLPLPAFSAAL